MLDKYYFKDIIILTVFIGLAFSFLLGSRPLNVPDEGRYCEIPREMLVTQNFVTPRINNIKYFEKPPLFYWMQAIALKLFGLNEWACRFVNALMALFGCLATYWTGRKLFNRQTGLYAAIIQTTSLLYFALARVVTLDMTVSLWLTLALFSFILGVYYRRCYYYGLYIFAAFAVLSKGLIGIIFPSSIITLWLLFTRNHWTVLKRCCLLLGSGIFLCLVLPWHITVQLKNPEFFHFYFIEQQFNRYLTMDAHRYQPVYYYLPILLLGLFPWTGFLYGAVKAVTKQKTESSHQLWFFIISFLFIFIFFSLSKSKLVPYILPCFPFLAIILGHYFAKISHHDSKKTLWFGILIIILTNIALIGGILFFIQPSITTEFTIAQKISRFMISILIVNGFVLPFVFIRKNFLLFFMTQVFFTVSFLFSLCALVPYIYMDSVKNIAIVLNTITKPTDIIATYDYYYQDLPFYLQRYVNIINWEGELEFGKKHTQQANRMMTDKSFWPYWQNTRDHHVYLLIPKELLPILKKNHPNKQFHLIAQEKNDVLLSNIINNT